MTGAIPHIPTLDATHATLQRACDCGSCASCAADEKLGVQTKLTLNVPGDAYEQEADRVADQVVSGAGLGSEPIATTPLVQRMESEAEEEDALQMKRETAQRMDAEDAEDEVQMKPTDVQRTEEEEDIQMKAAGSSSAQGSTGAAAVAVAGGGQPLSRSERAYFEPRFGHDLSRVRVHTDAAAGKAAKGINARAYTLRNHIAFAPGEYSGTTEGRRLMAHELVHTLQQDAARPKILQRRNIFQEFAGLFAGETFSDADLTEYLRVITETNAIQDYTDSDNKARALTERLCQGQDLFGFEDTVDLRKILILEMQSGATLGGDERSILHLMTSLDALQIGQLFEGANALSPDDLRGDIHGENRETLETLFHNLGIDAEGISAREDNVGCTAAERVAIAEAKRLSQADIAAAIAVLNDAPESSQVQNSFFLAFRVENPSQEQISDMVARLTAVRAGVGTVQYLCDHGGRSNSSCNRGAAGHASLGPTGDGVSICFMPNPGANAYNLTAETDESRKSELLTHEAAHFFLRVDDNGYFGSDCVETDFARTCLNGTQQNCGTSGRPPDERFDNADSYSCFVFYLARLDGEATETEDPLAERAEAYRGGGLSIDIVYPESILELALGRDVYVNAPPRTEVFIVDGEPSNSGFTHEWSVIVGTEELPLTPDTYRSKQAAYLPEASKAALRGSGATHAVIRLRTTPYRNAPESSVVERELRVPLTADEPDFGI